MSLALGRRLKIRTMIHLAGEPIPYFWPMRTFIHHNPLYGLEHLPFEAAVAEVSACSMAAAICHGACISAISRKGAWTGRRYRPRWRASSSISPRLPTSICRRF